jgi:hypothetical protein
LWVMTYREAQIQAFADAYLVIALGFAISIVMVPLLHRVARARQELRPISSLRHRVSLRMKPFPHQMKSVE